jgi:hypothetical protein
MLYIFFIPPFAVAGSKVVSLRVFVFAAGKLRLCSLCRFRWAGAGAAKVYVYAAAMQLKNGTFCIIEQERGGNSSGAPIFVVAVVFLSFMFLALALLCSGESFFDQLYSRNTLFFIFFLPLVSYERTLCEGKVITFWFARGL